MCEFLNIVESCTYPGHLAISSILKSGSTTAWTFIEEKLLAVGGIMFKKPEITQ